MLKKLYYVRTNGYDMLVSLDNDSDVRFLCENKYFPTNDDDILDFLHSVEDDSSWELEEDVEDLEEWLGIDYNDPETPRILFENGEGFVKWSKYYVTRRK